ncbi:ribonuclease R [Enterococcus sp. 8G7_MSG3316]|uniref:Ribonuclease R n=1 Tax=Candidatus Enterococcus testudinis TaxID=1834191 RepID=A0A242A8V7_9ENTE|nr:ribonuclease R [Enterococcus sp. 8G7_MSG3316]OTN77320.1 ribonuclease R [Enterococcus sp. 8G7_MSG3316]
MTENIKTKIVSFLKDSKKKSFSMEEIAEGLGLQKSTDFKNLVQTVAAMEREGTVIFNKKGKVKLPMERVLIEGTFRANERGFGFVSLADEEDDVYIPKEATNYAMDGDTVIIDIVHVADPFSDKGAEGKIVDIKQRAITQLVGEFTLFDEREIEESDLYGVVQPKDKKLSELKVFIGAQGIRPVDGSIVIVEISHYPEKGYATSLEGLITKVVGHKNDVGMDILSIVVANGIPTKFEEETLAAADAVPDTIDPADFPERRDLRDQQIVTIDGADAKDLDDAVTVKALPDGGFYLGVHIADVSYYVTQNSPLDKEAYERGTSVYLTDRVIPMIPQRLSNGICSLNPQVPRLTMSCEMWIDQQGQVKDYNIFQSIIQTSARMTYQAVNQILEENDPEVSAQYEALVPMFHDMRALHQVLEAMRTKRGAVSFEDREAKVLVDGEGHPQEIVLRERGVGERMIESFMLAANETVARHFNRLHFPFIYRIHEEPKEEKMRRFFDFASALGIVVKQSNGSISPKQLQQIVEDVADKPEAMVVNTMLLRSMQQAKYSEENVGHYGLAAEDYTHFTSPIRRYPDLIVHRLIRSYTEDPSETNQEKWAAVLPDIALHSSQMERRAVEAEREVDALKKAEYLSDKVGEEFDGIISSVVKFGLFIELPNTIEGLIHITALKQDYFHYLENHLALVGERTGLTFKIGQKVRIKVIKSDPETREIDFELVEAEEIPKLQAPKGKGNQRPQQAQHGRNSKGKDKSKTGRNQQRSDDKRHEGNGKGKPKKNGNKKKKPFYKGIKKK